MADPFAIFDEVDAGSASPQITGKSNCASSVLVLVRRFVSMHVPAVTVDLNQHPVARLPPASRSASASLASQLENATCALERVPPDLVVCQKAAESAAEMAWGFFARDGVWPHSAWKEAYVLLQLLLGCAHLALENDTAASLRCFDRAFIFGGATAVYRDCMELLDQPSMGPNTGQNTFAMHIASKPISVCGDEHLGALLNEHIQPAGRYKKVERYPCPQTADELREVQRQHVPLLFEGVAAGWPAMELWSNWSWLSEEYGTRLVPVELGTLASCGRSRWNERIMTLAEFVDTHLAEDKLAVEEGVIGYLAQHNLFEQLPRLWRDFTVPPCLAADLQHVNAWLGPKGTVTPLHYDSYDNVLVQVVGYKLVRMYSASQSARLYPRDAGGGGYDAQGNVSKVDIEAPDFELFPDFADAVGHACVIGPGEGLYIPAGCWHHVRSLSKAWSISFWFSSA